MAHSIDGKRVAFLATDMVEQVELTDPWKALDEAGAKPSSSRRSRARSRA